MKDNNFVRDFLIGLLVLFGSFTASSMSFAAITVDVDRTNISMGDLLQLTITGTSRESLDQLDLAVLQLDWEIVSSSSSTNTSFINGSRSTTRTRSMQLAPLRDGVLSIPPLAIEGNRTKLIVIAVDTQTGVDDLARFSIEVDKKFVYMQEQIVLTLTIEQANNLKDVEVSALALESAIVRDLGRENFQREINGSNWRITKQRYAIYPQKSGTLEIPKLMLSAVAMLPKRRAGTAPLEKRIALLDGPATVVVKAVPDALSVGAWLPATAVELSQSWSTAQEALVVGDPVTRTLFLAAEGVLANQLPNISSQVTSEKIDGFEIASESLLTDEKETARGFNGNKVRHEVLIPDEAGEWLFPAIEVPWWNTKTNNLEYATLPAQRVSVSQPVSASTLTLSWELLLNKLTDVLFREPDAPPPSDNGLGGKALQCFASTRTDIGIYSSADDANFWRFIGNGVVRDSIYKSEFGAEIKSGPVKFFKMNRDSIWLGRVWRLNRKSLKLINDETDKDQLCEIFYSQTEYFKQLEIIKDRVQLQIDEKIQENVI